MDEILLGLKDTPVPTLLVLGGLIFIFIAIVGRFAYQIDVPRERQIIAGIFGISLLLSGVILYIAPIPMGPSIRPVTPTVPVSTSTQDETTTSELTFTPVHTPESTAKVETISTLDNLILGSRASLCNGTEGVALCMYDINGSPINRYVLELPGWRFGDNSASWSPDGKQLVFALCDNSSCYSDLFISNADGTDIIRFTDSVRNNVYPSWSPNGKMIAFHSSCELHLVQYDGTGLRKLADQQVERCAHTLRWSPNSEWLAFVGTSPDKIPTPIQIWAVRYDGNGLQAIYTGPILNAFGGFEIAWTPDGNYIAVQVQGVINTTIVRIDAACLTDDNPCNEEDIQPSSEPIPVSWLPNYYPQWK